MQQASERYPFDDELDSPDQRYPFDGPSGDTQTRYSVDRAKDPKQPDVAATSPRTPEMKHLPSRRGRLKTLMSASLLGFGSALVATGLVDFFTGQQASQALLEFSRTMPPGAIQQLLHNFADMPTMMKLTTGPSVLTTSRYLDQWLGRNKR